MAKRQRIAPHKGDARLVTRDRKGRITSNERVNKNKPTKSTRNERASWSPRELKELSSLAKQNTPTRVISLKLGRSVPSIRAKARSARISLKPANRSPYARRAAVKTAPARGRASRTGRRA